MMRTVYDAAHGAEAQIVVDVLAGEDIHAIVTGAGLLGAAGDLPVTGLVQVRVDEADVGRALAVIADWKSAHVADEPEPASHVPPPRAGGRWRWLLAGALIGAGATFAVMYPWPNVQETDLDGNGNAELRWIRAGDRVVRGEWDYDDDGHADVVRDYGRSEGSFLESRDADFDRRFELQIRYVNDVPVSAEGDIDGDDFDEYEAKYRHGYLAEETWRDPVTRAVRTRVTWQGYRRTSEVDTDGDGRLDTRREHDARGEVVRSEAIR